MTQRKQRRHIALELFVAGAVVICGLTAFIHVQRYTTYGIFLLGGSQYWIHRAIYEKDDEQAKGYLRNVLAATQYGVNTAENAVTSLDYSPDTYRISILLADIAPNNNLRERYLKLAERYKDRTPKGDFDIYN